MAIWQHIRNYWKKGKTTIALYLGPIVVVIFLILKRNEYTSFDDVIESISVFTGFAAFVTVILIGGIDGLMLLSDWYAKKIEEDKKKQAYISNEVIRQRSLIDLIEAEQRGLSLEEIIDELKLPKRIKLLDFQTRQPFNLLVNDTSGSKFDMKGIIWLTITLRENNTYSLSAITRGEDINGLPDITNNVMIISEDEYKMIEKVCKNRKEYHGRD